MNISGATMEQFAGLSEAEAAARLARFGPNTLPEPRPPSLLAVFLRQFLSPLIYILLAAALVSLALSDVSDALFIGAVLFVNGIVGAAQEYSAGRAAAALRQYEVAQAHVVRDGSARRLDARELVPGDLVLLEAGDRVSADIQLLEAIDLKVDESLLTGESAAVGKSPAAPDPPASRAYAGTLVTRGRGRGVVSATGHTTELGRIAGEIGKRPMTQPPLMIRLEHFSRLIAVTVGISVVLLIIVGSLRDMPFHTLFLMAVGLAVSAIPEGLPVAISIALAVGMRRMAAAHVIVRNMPAVESLGSCTIIATDKTGTLTLNELTVTDVCLPEGTKFVFEAGEDLEACAVHSTCPGDLDARGRVSALLKAASLPNEARLSRDVTGWKGLGDTVDVALLAAARKAGIRYEDVQETYPLVARIPYEPDIRYAASFHRRGKGVRIFVKGAPETLIAMAAQMDTGGGPVPIDHATLLGQKEEMAARGLRVLAFAEGTVAEVGDGRYGHGHLVDLLFLGMAGMQDPIRSEVPQAIADCRAAGVEVAMVTGDDPRTAAAIAAQAGLQFTEAQVVTGEAVRRAEEAGEAELDRLTRTARIYARVDPAQKLSIVLSLARGGHFVAATGDGVNDAPALTHAHVGVAMGRKGTDVARESADIVLTDDNFASIVAGIREGRIAYANIRKVVFMVVSTGAAEVVLFLLAIPLGLPMPLLPVQLLWLNLVTNGIQDIALATEKAEGDELAYPPRRPGEPIFDRVMIRRIVHSTVVMGFGGFALFWWLLEKGTDPDTARNMLLLLFVLFENFQTFNSRSEHHSVFRRGFLSNRFLVLGVIAAQALHIGAMYMPGLSDTLGLAPVSLVEWAWLLLAASTLLAVMEFEKWWDKRHR
ncbi:HAD-IC family P-type ATPase [Nitratireductor sp. ZSWI3]|uniref:cation-translocating P-type ATPase n=1 Tax=Nitratireductor sp. ZSWI3 TaxID=2966359 RepID=UPI00214F6DE2|nr:HAD-IC family P-type ATPase [Nitratireductor sp. ZSWI3]MCR4264743.1 HAD-IC family P-type ATPase [Nitratireductor sp. ZSWI3]